MTYADDPRYRFVSEAKLTQALADNISGGFYLNKDGQRVEYVYVVSDTDPGQSKVIDGKTYEVWWVQVAPPDPNQWVPKPVTASIESRSYTVPVDAGATYTVDGVPKPAGTYALGTTAAKSLPWAAVAKSGYGFKAGAVTSGSLVYPAKTYASGDVLMSDSFNRADGSLAGTTSDSYAGGEPYQWTGKGIIKAGILQPADTANSADSGNATYTLPAATIPFGIEFDLPARPNMSQTGRITLSRADGTNLVIQVDHNGNAEVQSNVGGSNQKILLAVNLAPGNRYRLSTADGKTWESRNVTTGAVAAVNSSATNYPLASASGITRVDLTMQALAFTNFQVDNLKVFIP